MSNLPPRPSIQNLGLEDKEEVQLYLELIRIIEKDIDEIDASDTRSGWTSWAIMGGIAGALLFLLGETRKLQTFPTEEVKHIGLAFIIFYNFAVLTLNIFNVDSSIRPGRIRWSKDLFFPYIPTAIYRLILFLFLTFIAITLAAPWVVRITTSATFSLWALWIIFLAVFSTRKFPIGNAKNYRKYRFVLPTIIISLSILALVLLMNQIRFPLGEAATLPYLLAGLISVILILVERLITTLTPSRLLSNLQDLRNDIIFLRVEIDEALQRYEVLKEGETMPDALKEELSDLVNRINVIEYAYSNMDKLLDKMESNLPSSKDSKEEIQQKQKQFSLDKDSYSLHNEKCLAIDATIETKTKELNAKLSGYATISGDWASENFIRSSLIERLTQLVTMKSNLIERFRTIDYFMSNPDKIPPKELGSSTQSNNSPGEP